ncbi:hypothetical protein J5N97_025648 [Dioscorea zingiberensis]|uniref:Uncharacterized protein n=1 Tax=Dioscorea zingiberensis TaxID=325984 RepID=A0A9D5C158_9LILI|nr:hypothetical protein J5N97_025648 [Dioscorea zingiberensis]
MASDMVTISSAPPQTSTASSPMAPRPSPASSPSSPLSPFSTTTPSSPTSTPNPTASSTTSSSIPSPVTPSPSAARNPAGGSADRLQGFKAAAYFLVGSEVSKGSWDCPPEICPKYDSSVPFEKLVDDGLSYFDLPIDKIPVFVALYLEEPDSKGHEFGPDQPEITNAVARIDTMISGDCEALAEASSRMCVVGIME